MKIKHFLATTIVAALGLVGCGDGVQSPDFTGVLTELTLTAPDAPVDPNVDPDYPDRRVLPLGLATDLVVVATFTTPPGSASDTVDVAATDVSFTLDPADAGTVENNQFVGTVIGEVVTITATKDGITSDPIFIRIAPPALTGIQIDPATATVPAGGSRVFRADGTYTDGVLRPQSVTWSEASTFLSTAPPTGVSTTATVAGGTAIGQTAELTATAVIDGTTYTDSATITVGDIVPVDISAVVCSPNPIGVGFSSTCSGTVTYSDNTTESTTEAPGLVTWTSDNAAVTVDPSTGVATGVTAGGSANITATLNSDNSQTASTLLSVLASASARCPQPLVDPAAVASDAFSATCLACAVNNPQNVIDDDAATFGTIDVTLALLNGTATLAVNALPANTLFSSSTPAGFIVAQPPGMLLSAELLSTLTVSTLDNTGAVLESGGGAVPQPQTVPPVPLQVTLLGMIGGQEAALVSIPTSIPFNGIALTFDSGVVSLLPSIAVAQACAVANPDAPAP